jgi:LemA protein
MNKGWIGCLVVVGAVILIALVVGGWLAGRYNGMVQQNEQVNNGWAQVKVVLQRRADLIPNLVETVKGYAAHEKDTLEAVMKARAQATQVKVSVDQLTPENMQKFEQAQGALSSALGRLLAVSEAYPNLKANENFRDLQVQLEGTENRIATARRRYIQAVQEFNNVITVPPTSFTNMLFYHKKAKPQFAATTPGAEQAPKVKF